VTALALIDTASSLSPFQPALSAHEQIGFELGWDHAHHQLTPPAPYDREDSALRHGWMAGRAAFGPRTLRATRHVRQWLQLRLQAWLHGRSVELFQVTPHYLQQIEASHCPITRQALMDAEGQPRDGVVHRVRSDAAYAAGNLVSLSSQAHHARAHWGHRDALGFAQRIEAEGLGGLHNLHAHEWRRLAVLASFVEALPHEAACALPLLVLPPNRLRLFNPVQALQAFISQQLLKPGWAQRVSRFEALLPSTALQRDFKAFFMALLPRVLEAGALTERSAMRWAVEDAWRCPRVLRRWTHFARQLSAEQCEALLRTAHARGLGTQRIEASSDQQATDGWQLDTRGYVPATEARTPTLRPPVQLSLV
jgi:hypothetical protein